VTAAYLAPYLTQRFFDNNGNPLVGGTVQTYAGGTTTPIATYVDSTGGTPNTNPITLNFRGEASIWLLPNVSYKFVISDSLGNLITTIDNVVNAALISLYGGVDTGVVNAYILNFASPVPPNTNGQVIYWQPANSNTGPSTINVNGAGVQPILNPNGTQLGANQLLANQFVSIISINGTWQLYGGSGTGVNVGTFGAEVPLTSAATTDLGSVPGHNVQITGTTPITSFGTSAQQVAPIYIGRFTNTLTLTNSASLILPTGNNILTGNGDAFIAEFLGAGNWKVLFYQSAALTGLNVSVKQSDTARLSTTTLAADPDLAVALLTGQYSYELFLLFDSVAAGAGFKFQSTGTAVDSRGTSPAGATGLVNAAAYGPKLESFVGGALSYATVGTGANSNQVSYKGSLLVTTPGTFGIQWAQVASTASNTTLRAGSYLSATLLGQKTGSPGPTQHLYTTAGGFTENIPSGYTTATIEAWGATARGGATFFNAGNGNFTGGGGSGSGGYCRTVISVSGAGGQTINITVGAAGGPTGGSTIVSSGTFTVATMTATGSTRGGDASAGVPGVGGAAGTATGGVTVNTPGNAGQAGQTPAGGGGGGSGGAGIPGINYGGNPGIGGSYPSAVPGLAGIVSIVYA
jgi:hypothetical protein